MIARMWRGVTSAEQAEEYFAYLRETGLKDYRAIAGNRGVQILRRTYEGKAEFLLISLWESYEAIRTFAGPRHRTSRLLFQGSSIPFGTGTKGHTV
jgi:heme-degrading monooxygenase HmoA